ncbi:hypothetical protein BGZ67_007362 [Mortierella alpina]|nr:hypothetical protein BGZ67_007362 [Mortierella alpina]
MTAVPKRNPQGGSVAATTKEYSQAGTVSAATKETPQGTTVTAATTAITIPITTEPESELTTLQQRVAALEPAAPAPGKLATVGNAAFTAGSNIIAAQKEVKSALETTTKIIGTESDNAVLSNLIQITGKLADVGKTIPFLGPAFVVLKIIIDIEQQARDVDEKCQDLLERISFMLSHMLVLEGVEEKIEPLMQVLLKVQDTLKEAAALIEAYRKQGKIVRRLKMSNKENFESVVARVTSCSTDLMLSLQIQQTGDLSLLKRSVPRDLEAEQFVRDRGGEDVVNSNPVLVEEFAKRMHLAMSDQVMEQMTSNMQEILHDNQQQIETLIRQSSTTTVTDMAEAFAIQAREHEAARRVICVQCDKEYLMNANGPEACAYHSAGGSTHGNRCCGQTSPCKTGYHQPKHHSGYPYANFFPWAHNIVDYSDTVDYWLRQEESDLETDNGTQIVRVGRMLRWRTWEEPITKATLVVNVGHISEDLSYFLKTFTVEELEEQRKVIVSTGDRLIFKNARDSETLAFSKAEWILDEDSQQLKGIKFTIKVASSELATVGTIPFDPKILEMPKDQSVEYFSKVQLDIFAPDKPYEFPKTVQLGPTLRVEQLREPRSFKSKASSAMPLIVLTANNLAANNHPQRSNKTQDRFTGLWRGLNTSTLASPKQTILLSAKAEYRLVGDPEYRPVESFELRNDIKFPLAIEPSKAIDIPFEILIGKPERVLKRIMVSAWNYAHVCIRRPLRIRVTFFGLDGETCTHVQEYVQPRCYWGCSPPKENDVGYFFVDDLDLGTRYTVTVTSNPSPSRKHNHVVSFRGTDIARKLSADDLHRVVYRAERAGVTEVDLKLGCTDAAISWTVWALVDLSCRRVYGFKVMLELGSMFAEKLSATVGYAPCPLYGGDDLDTRPIQYAVENNTMPKVQTRDGDEAETAEDDAFDDEDEPEKADTVSESVQMLAIKDAVPVSPAVVQAAEASNAESREVEGTGRNGTENKGFASMDSLVSTIAVLEARLAAMERHDHLLSRILDLEKKAASSSEAAESSRMDKVEARLESMDMRLETLDSSVRQLDTNAARVAEALEKIAVLLTP